MAVQAEIGIHRKHLVNSRRVIIKVGTNVLVTGSSLDRKRFDALSSEIAKIKESGREVILVTSGAIGAGMKLLGLARRPKKLHDQQIAASVGQSLLMAEYARSFAKHEIVIGQLLLTHDDLSNRKRHLNLRYTLLGLLRRGCIPVVNENDVVSVDAIKVGDNDALAAMLGILVGADLVILLSTTDGLKRPISKTKNERVPFVGQLDEEVLSWVMGKENDLSVGGMGTKLKATQTLLDGGASVVIADGRDPKNISKILAGGDIGTLFGSPEINPRAHGQSRKKWLAFFHRPEGAVIIDDGAVRALKERGFSLLPVGVSKLEGSFSVGALINVKDKRGNVVARGLADYSSETLELIKGKKTPEVAKLLGAEACDEVIHRDNMVLV